MMWMIPITILTICLTISLLVAMSWSRRDLRSQLSDYLETNREIMRDYTSLTRTLLGVAPDSPLQTQTTSQELKRPEWQPPEAEFGSLPVDQDLMREYEEHLARNGTLSGRPARTHPEVQQITPGQVTIA
jgi:hypothetical protein